MQSKERGQILPIFVGGLILLLLIGALVIDIGFVLTIRRQEQNAADTAAIAAARYIRPTADTYAMQTSACFYARQNGFFPSATNNSECDAAHDPNGSTLAVHYPPSGAAGTFAGRPGFVEVVISRTHRTFLASVIGLANIPVTSSAVAAYSNGDSNSNSLVALDPGGCSGSEAGRVTGRGTVEIRPVRDPATGFLYDGGYIHVNSTCGASGALDNFCGTSGSSALGLNGTNSTVIAPKVLTSGSCIKSTNTTFTSPLLEGAVQIGDPLADLPPPGIPSGTPGAYCGDPAVAGTTQTTAAGSNGCTFNANGSTVTLWPGVYYGGWSIGGNNVTIVLKPGIYIIAGGGISLAASGTLSSVVGSSGPAPVMIFNTDNPTKACPGGATKNCQNSVNFTAGSDLLLRGLDSGPYKGILIWQDGNGSAGTASSKMDVTLSGQGSLSLSGTIYAPRALVTLAGGSTGEGFASVQIIAWRWNIVGGGTLLMPYDPKDLYHFDQMGLVK